MKTSLLAAITNNESPIFAVEKSFRRYETLKTMLDMLGVSNATSLNLNFTDINPGDYPDAEYILVDPSCSGSGQPAYYFYLRYYLVKVSIYIPMHGILIVSVCEEFDILICCFVLQGCLEGLRYKYSGSHKKRKWKEF